MTLIANFGRGGLAGRVGPLQPPIAKQFGPDFNVDARYEPLYGDFDGTLLWAMPAEEFTMNAS